MKLLLTSLLFTVVYAGESNYGSLAYDSGGQNQFNMETLLQLTNQARAEKQVAPLVIDSRLFQASTVHCQAMLTTRIFDHNAGDGSPAQRATEAGFKWNYDSENIYMGGGDATQAHKAWMNSPGHYANIMNPTGTRVGFAVCGNPGEDQYWVAHFANEMTSTGNQYLVDSGSQSPVAQAPIKVQNVAPVIESLSQVVPVKSPVVDTVAPQARIEVKAYAPRKPKKSCRLHKKRIAGY